MDYNLDELGSYQSFRQGSYRIWCMFSKDHSDLYVENEWHETKSRISIIPLLWCELIADIITLVMT